MKLSKLERHTAYIIMLDVTKDKINYKDKDGICAGGFCWMLWKLFDIGIGGSESDIEIYFPELFNKRPPVHSYIRFWFKKGKSGWQKRIELLKQCIIETY